jgi:glycosyltransferase involved in cell wall biosynthesis
MKIAVFHNLPSGGAKRSLYGNIDYLVRDHDVDLFVPKTANEEFLPLKDLVNEIKSFSFKNTIPGYLWSAVKYFPFKQISLIDLEKAQRVIAKNINLGRYDVVLCEQDQYTMTPFFLKYVRKPTVYFCQQPIIFRNEVIRNISEKAGLKNYNLLSNFFLNYYANRLTNTEKNNIKHTKYVVANSYFSRETILRSYGINSFVSYLGVDVDLFEPSDISKENFVLSVGQCLPEKGYEFILNSLARIDRSMRPYLVIVSDQGNVNWKRYLESLAIKLDVKLRILNMINDEELVLLYNKSKLVVYAPYLEPFGLVPLEAMSCGTPVVAVKEGGVRESIIHGKTGILTPRDEEIFARKVSELIMNDEKYDKMVNECIKSVHGFWKLEDAGKRLLEHLNHAIGLYDK